MVDAQGLKQVSSSTNIEDWYWTIAEPRIRAALTRLGRESLTFRCGKCRRVLGEASPHYRKAVIVFEGMSTGDGRGRLVPVLRPQLTGPRSRQTYNPRPWATIIPTGVRGDGDSQLTFACHPKKCGMRRAVTYSRQIHAFLDCVERGSGELVLGVDM